MDAEEQNVQNMPANIRTCNIAMRALWRPLRLIHFLTPTSWVLQWDSEKRPKAFKNKGLERFGRTLLERPIWNMRIKRAFPCSMALVLRFREAFPCSVALVLPFAKCFPCSVALVLRFCLGPVGRIWWVWIRSVWICMVWLDPVCLMPSVSGSDQSGCCRSGSGLSGSGRSGSGPSGSSPSV